MPGRFEAKDCRFSIGEKFFQRGNYCSRHAEPFDSNYTVYAKGNMKDVVNMPATQLAAPPLEKFYRRLQFLTVDQLCKRLKRLARQYSTYSHRVAKTNCPQDARTMAEVHYLAKVVAVEMNRRGVIKLTNPNE